MILFLLLQLTALKILFSIKYCKRSSFLHAFIFSQMHKFVLYVWQPGKGHDYLQCVFIALSSIVCRKITCIKS